MGSSDTLALFAGNANPVLAQDIARSLRRRSGVRTSGRSATARSTSS